jgi:hypothetical protein
MFPDPEVTKQKAIEKGMAGVDSTWQDNPDATPGENAAAKYEAYQTAVSPYLAPSARLLLQGKITALRADAFNQKRALGADGRADQAATDAHNRAVKQLTVEEARMKDADAKRQFGGTPYVFQFPDGSTAPAPMGSDKYAEYMGMVDKGQAILVGSLTERQRAEDAQKLEEYKQANKPLKLYTVPTAKLTTYNDMNGISILLANIAGPEGQAGLARSGGVTNYMDRLLEKVVNHVGTIGGLLPEKAVSSFFATNVNKLRLLSQALIKGVPSNADQAIAELSNIGADIGPELNAMRISIITDDAADRIRAAYADFKQNAAPGQPPPLAIRTAMARMGIDEADVGTQEEEYARMATKADARIDQIDTWKKSAGVSGDAHFNQETGKWEGDPSTSFDNSAPTPQSSYRPAGTKPQNSVEGPNGTVITW